MKKKKAINFAAIALKINKDAQIVVHGRAFDQLEWLGPGPKPSLALFEAFAEEDEREARKDAYREELNSRAMIDLHEAQRAKTLEEIRPAEDKIREELAQVSAEITAVRLEALRTQELLRLADEVEDCWREITAAEAMARQNAQRYLQDTAHYLSWDADKIPANIQAFRASAHEVMARTEGRKVYANWKALRAGISPSKEEIREAIREGGERLKEVQRLAREAELKFPKPRIT